jgi:hypothetical protein
MVVLPSSVRSTFHMPAINTTLSDRAVEVNCNGVACVMSGRSSAAVKYWRTVEPSSSSGLLRFLEMGGAGSSCGLVSSP